MKNMHKHKASQVFIAAFTVALSVVGAATFSRAESVTAQENLEKLKATNSCRGCDLSGLTLNRANLAGADLEGADFSKTKFHLTNLSGANLRNANLKGASFAGTDLGEADLRGADLRGASLEGAYLEKALLEGEFITAKPYEEIGVTDVEKQVYVPNPVKPKESPKTGAVKVATGRDAQPPPPPAGGREIKPSPEKKPGKTDNVARTADDLPSGAPPAKKAVPVRQAIVEPQESAGQTKAEAVAAVVPDSAKMEGEKSEPSPGNLSSSPAPAAQKMAKVGKPSPVPPAAVKMDEVAAVKDPGKKAVDWGADGSGANLGLEKGKRERLTRLLDEEKCLGCDLSGLDLSGKNLKNVDLERADLTGCNLERVNLDKANLKGAVLQNAILRMASLKNADLYKADLSGADLSGANVEGAKLDNAKLSSVIGLGKVMK